MKNIFKPASFLLYAFTIPIFFVLGGFLAAISGAAEGQGLAGGAIVFFYGLISAFIAFVLALIVAYNVSHKSLVLINKVLGGFFIILVCFIIYRFITLNGSDDPPSKDLEPKETTAPAVEASSLYIPPLLFKKRNYQNETSIEMGMGFFKPNFYDDQTLYFYGDVNFEKSLMDHSPKDSITFRRNEYGQFHIATAPPWLIPDHLKLDYDMLYFKVISISPEFLEVIVNTNNEQTSFVSRSSGEFVFWPDFLLQVNSVEMIPDLNEKVKVKPLNYAGDVSTEYSFLRPIQIQNNWMLVDLIDDNDKKTGEGWIQWKRNDELLILYNLLS